MGRSDLDLSALTIIITPDFFAILTNIGYYHNMEKLYGSALFLHFEVAPLCRSANPLPL
jgi:hypothetical protein